MQNVSDVAKQWIRDKGGELLSQDELQKRLVAIDQQAEQKSAEDYLALKRKVYERDSLWPSGKKTTFSFERWLPERQQNKTAAIEIKKQTQN